MLLWFGTATWGSPFGDVELEVTSSNQHSRISASVVMSDQTHHFVLKDSIEHGVVWCGVVWCGVHGPNQTLKLSIVVKVRARLRV